MIGDCTFKVPNSSFSILFDDNGRTFLLFLSLLFLKELLLLKEACFCTKVLTAKLPTRLPLSLSEVDDCSDPDPDTDIELNIDLALFNDDMNIFFIEYAYLKKLRFIKKIIFDLRINFSNLFNF